MDVRYFLFFVSDLDALSETLSRVRSEQGFKFAAYATIKRPHGEFAVRSFRFLGKGVSTGLQV